MRRYWHCPKCHTRNERAGGRKKCAACGRAAPKAKVPKHAVALRDVTYEQYVELNALIHGVTDESCAVCGKPRGQHSRHDRDHGHDRTENSFGKPRGLACGGDYGCNKVMSRLTLERARLIVAYLERVETYYERELNLERNENEREMNAA